MKNLKQIKKWQNLYCDKNPTALLFTKLKNSNVDNTEKKLLTKQNKTVRNKKNLVFKKKKERKKMVKLNNSKCHISITPNFTSQKHKLWQNLTTQTMITLKNSKSAKTKQKSNFDKFKGANPYIWGILKLVNIQTIALEQNRAFSWRLSTWLYGCRHGGPARFSDSKLGIL